jgi:hypothetical protein
VFLDPAHEIWKTANVPAILANSHRSSILLNTKRRKRGGAK